jgi:hypothetical protein
MTNEEKIEQARIALTCAIDELPRCRCGTIATTTCLDAAGMGVYKCDSHSFVGGMCGDEDPVPLRHVKFLQEALTILT